MDMREAFEKLYPREELTGKTISIYATPEEHEYAWGAWQAACEWQKQKDAEICMNHSDDKFYNLAEFIADEIRDQGKDNG